MAHRNATTEGEGGVRCECGWLGTLGTWPGHALDARSGADTVKLILTRLKSDAESFGLEDSLAYRNGGRQALNNAIRWIREDLASGADRPEGSQR